MDDNKEEVKEITQKELNKLEIKENGFLNPYSAGVTYVDFLAELKDKKVADYLKGKLTDEEISFVEKELSLIKKDK